MKIGRYHIIFRGLFPWIEVFTGYCGDWEDEDITRVYPKGFTRAEKKENREFREYLRSLKKEGDLKV